METQTMALGGAVEEANPNKPAVAAVMKEAELLMEKLCSDMTRSVIRSAQFDLLCTSERELYNFLSSYFDKLMQHHQQVASVGIAKADVLTLVNAVLLPAIHSQLVAEKGDITKCYAVHRTLRADMSKLNINCGAFADALDLARVGDPKTPFGSVNVLYFVAVYATLCPVQQFSDLLQLVYDAAAGGASDAVSGRRVAAAVVRCWATLDKVNSDDLLALAQHIEAVTAAASFEALCEEYPQAKQIHSRQAQQRRAQTAASSEGASPQAREEPANEGEEPYDEVDECVGGPMANATAQVVVLHDAEDVPGSTMYGRPGSSHAHLNPSPVHVVHGEGDAEPGAPDDVLRTDDASGEEAEEVEGGQPSDPFWSQLVS